MAFADFASLADTQPLSSSVGKSEQNAPWGTVVLVGLEEGQDATALTSAHIVPGQPPGLCGGYPQRPPTPSGATPRATFPSTIPPCRQWSVHCTRKQMLPRWTSAQHCVVRREPCPDGPRVWVKCMASSWIKLGGRRRLLKDQEIVLTDCAQVDLVKSGTS